MIIDFHTHIFPSHVERDKPKFLERDVWFGTLYSSPKAKIVTAENLVASMDANGVDKSVTFGFAWMDEGLCREANDYVIDAVSRFPDRLVGFISTNPCKPEAMQREVERCVARGLAGIGELMPDGQGFCFDRLETMTPLAEIARHYRLPILTRARAVSLLRQLPVLPNISPMLCWFALTGEAASSSTNSCPNWWGSLPMCIMIHRPPYLCTGTVSFISRARSRRTRSCLGQTIR
jgi:predicted TIM-barrel fold metal-dependent hydrolase